MLVDQVAVHVPGKSLQEDMATKVFRFATQRRCAGRSSSVTNGAGSRNGRSIQSCSTRVCHILLTTRRASTWPEAATFEKTTSSAQAVTDRPDRIYITLMLYSEAGHNQVVSKPWLCRR